MKVPSNRGIGIATAVMLAVGVPSAAASADNRTPRGHDSTSSEATSSEQAVNVMTYNILELTTTAATKATAGWHRGRSAARRRRRWCTRPVPT
jgi:hypothetical protein